MAEREIDHVLEGNDQPSCTRFAIEIPKQRVFCRRQTPR